MLLIICFPFFFTSRADCHFSLDTPFISFSHHMFSFVNNCISVVLVVEGIDSTCLNQGTWDTVISPFDAFQ